MLLSSASQCTFQRHADVSEQWASKLEDFVSVSVPIPRPLDANGKVCCVLILLQLPSRYNSLTMMTIMIMIVIIISNNNNNNNNNDNNNNDNNHDNDYNNNVVILAILVMTMTGWIPSGNRHIGIIRRRSGWTRRKVCVCWWRGFRQQSPKVASAGQKITPLSPM
jgi:hypothetical protein